MGRRQFPSGSLYYCFVTTVQYKKCCFTTTITEVCNEYVSPVRPTPALRDQRRCAGCVSLLRQPKPETLPGAQRRRMVDDHQMPALPVLGPARALVAARLYRASHRPSLASQPFIACIVVDRSSYCHKEIVLCSQLT